MITCISVVVFFSSLLLGGVDCLTCLDCLNVQGAEYCLFTKQCGPHEHCFSDVYVDANGNPYWNFGCRDSQQCTTAGKRARPKRASTAELICEGCCKTNLCANGICGTPPLQPLSKRGPICFECPQHSGPGTCNIIKHCGIDQVCMTKKAQSGLFESSCAIKQSCEDTLNFYKGNFGILGRRSGYSLEFSPANHCFMKCCGDDLCNGVCGTNTVQTTPAPANPCLSNPCVHGTCSIYQNDYMCTCTAGAHGRNCDIIADPCQGYQCGHGTCYNNHGSAQCTCNTGYTGMQCDHVVDPCQGYQCGHGTCFNNHGNAQCTCNTGYTGTHCDQVLDPCQGYQCGHGTCKNNHGNAQCTCNTGYTGTHCDQIQSCDCECPDGWVYFRDSCYLFADNIELDWTEAGHYCNMHHRSSLAVIETAEENTFVKDMCHRLTHGSHKSNQSFWIAGSDSDIEGIWEWYPDNTPVTYTDWHSGQPDSAKGGEDCLDLSPYMDFLWNDDHCEEHKRALCEVRH